MELVYLDLKLLKQVKVYVLNPKPIKGSLELADRCIYLTGPVYNNHVLRHCHISAEG